MLKMKKLYFIIVTLFIINAGFLYYIDWNEKIIVEYNSQFHKSKIEQELFDLMGPPANAPCPPSYSDYAAAKQKIESLYRYMALTDICIAATIAAAIYNKKNKPLQ